MPSETMTAAHPGDGGGPRRFDLLAAIDSEDTFSPLDLQVTCLRRRFDIELSTASTIAGLCFGEARE